MGNRAAWRGKAAARATRSRVVRAWRGSENLAGHLVRHGIPARPPMDHEGLQDLHVAILGRHLQSGLSVSPGNIGVDLSFATEVLDDAQLAVFGSNEHRRGAIRQAAVRICTLGDEVIDNRGATLFGRVKNWGHTLVGWGIKRRVPDIHQKFDHLVAMERS